MKFKLISDSHDAMTGMRLAGVEGVPAKNGDEARTAIESCVSDESVGVVLITESLAMTCSEYIDSLQLSESGTLIVTIPGSRDERTQDNITKYIREAIGIKI